MRSHTNCRSRRFLHVRRGHKACDSARGKDMQSETRRCSADHRGDWNARYEVVSDLAPNLRWSTWCHPSTCPTRCGDRLLNTLKGDCNECQNDLVSDRFLDAG